MTSLRSAAALALGLALVFGPGSAWAAAEERVALAGYRLADLLNRTLGS